MKQRIINILLILAILFTSADFSVFAAEISEGNASSQSLSGNDGEVVSESEEEAEESTTASDMDETESNIAEEDVGGTTEEYDAGESPSEETSTSAEETQEEVLEEESEESSEEIKNETGEEVLPQTKLSGYNIQSTGTWGSNITYSLTDDGTLIISGTGRWRILMDLQ